MTPKQQEIVKALGLSGAKARGLKVEDLFDSEGLYLGPPEAGALCQDYYDWLRSRMPKGSRPDPGEKFFARVPRLKLNDNCLSVAEMKKLLRVIRENKGRSGAVRDYYLILLGYRMALRVSELESLSVGDMVTDELLEVKRKAEIRGKGQVLRKVVLYDEGPQGTRKQVKAFLRWKKRSGESLELEAPLFVSRKGNRLSVRQIQQIVADWVERAGVERITAHGLRHTGLTHLCTGPKGVLVANEIAGHKNLATTQRYLHVQPEDYAVAMGGMV